MNKIEVSVVSYLNSKLFLFGLNNYPHIKNLINIHTDVPSICAEKVINKDVAVGLIPTAALFKNESLSIFSNYCISSNSNVQSVILASNCELNEIKKVYLDSDSKTSVNLTKVLAKNFWKINPVWENKTDIEKATFSKDEAAVIIGDKVFQMKDKFKYTYDLAEEWHKFTNKPFVFAIWASNNEPDRTFTSLFNSALKFGIENRNIVIHQAKHNYPNLSLSDISYYFTKNLDFDLNDEKRDSIKLFLNYLHKL